MYYIKSRRIAYLFALLCVLASFSLGNIIQLRAASDAMQGVFGVPPIAVGIAAAILCAAVIAGGVRGISDMTVKLIPVLSVLYIVASMYIIIINMGEIPSVISRILSEAFDLRAAAGGIGGFALSRGMRYGIARGLFSNEAGCGTAPIAHAQAETDSAAKQGCWGIFEVFADTVLLCSMTAFVIIVAMQKSADLPIDDSGMALVIGSYSLYLGRAAEYFIALSVAFFAAATLICWAHYGMEGLRYITSARGKNSRTALRIYTLAYCAAAVFGGVISGELIWQLTDLSVAVMTVINVAAICSRSDEIALETKAYFGSGKRTPAARASSHLHGISSSSKISSGEKPPAKLSVS